MLQISRKAPQTLTKFAPRVASTAPRMLRFLTVGQEVVLRGVKFLIKGKLGRGVSRSVFRAVSPQDQKNYAFMEFDTVKPFLGSKWLGTRIYGSNANKAYKSRVMWTVNRENRFKEALGIHPNLDTTILHQEEVGDSLLIVKPMAQETLDQYIRSGTVNFPKMLKLYRGMAGGLQYMHEKGVIHADFKKANVLVDEGNPLISDFGHSEFKQNSEAMEQRGDPRYVDPKVTSLDEQCDVFALLLTMSDLIASDDWLTGDEKKDQSIHELRSYLHDAIRQTERHQRPTLDRIIAEIDRLTNATEELEGYPCAHKRTTLTDDQIRAELCWLFDEDHWDYEAR